MDGLIDTEGIRAAGWRGGEGAERVGMAAGLVLASVSRATAAAEAGGSGERVNDGMLPPLGCAFGVVGDVSTAAPFRCGVACVAILGRGGGGGIAALSAAAGSVVSDSDAGISDDVVSA